MRGRSGLVATAQTLIARTSILGINLLTGIIVARGLGPVGRGEVTAMTLWPLFLAHLLTLGFPSSLTFNLRKYQNERGEFVGAALLTCTLLGIVGGAVGYAFVPYVLGPYGPDVIWAARLFMINVPVVLLMTVCYAILEATDDISASNRTRLLVPGITLMLLAAFALTGRLTSATAASAYVISGLPVFWMIARISRRTGLRVRLRRLKEHLGRLLHYGVRSYGVDVQNVLAMHLDQVLVVGLLKPALMGTYVVALSVSRMLMVVQMAINTVLFPKTASLPQKEVLAITGRAARVGATLSACGGAVIFVAGPWLIGLFYGPDFLGAVTVLRLLAVEVVLANVTLILAQPFMALNRPGLVAFLQSSGLLLCILLLVLLAPTLGLTGVGIAMLSATSFRFIGVLASYRLVLKTPPPRLLLRWSDVRELRERLRFDSAPV